MAKAQKRSNRELKKPKAKKGAVTAAPPTLKGMLDPVTPPKKKG